MSQIEVRKGSPYTLLLETNNTITGSTEVKGIYEKPDGTTGEVSGTISGTTIISVTVTGAVNDTKGLWKWHASCIFSGDIAATVGDVVKVNVKDLYKN